MSACLLHHFAGLQDPGVEGNQRHELLDMVLRTVCAVLSGADGWEATSILTEGDFGRDKLTWLRRFGRFANGLPSHDCMANVISRLTPQGFGNVSAVGRRRWRG